GALVQPGRPGGVARVRGGGAGGPGGVAGGGLAGASREGPPAPAAGTDEHRYVITDRGSATLKGVLDEDVSFTFAAIPDRAPTIQLTKDPEPQSRGSLQLAYKVEDDYGVISAQANFALKDKARADGTVPRALYGAPDFPLVLPQL